MLWIMIIVVAKVLNPQLSLRISKSPQFNYDYLKENTHLIISYMGNFRRYCSDDPLETLLGGWMRSVCQKSDWMTKICEILAVFFDRMANYFDDILISVELQFLYRYLSSHRLAEGRNNMIPREKATTEKQTVAPARQSVWFPLGHDRSA
jgi:hypothetical protein